jgi:hypothetical protein
LITRYLISIKNIKPYTMSSVGKDSDIKCTAVGYLPWQSPENKIILVKCYYSTQASDTIISPSDIVLSLNSRYHSWTQHSDCQTGERYIKFTNNEDDTSITFPLHQENGLWFYHNTPMDYDTEGTIGSDGQQHSTIRTLGKPIQYDLIHARNSKVDYTTTIQMSCLPVSKNDKMSSPTDKGIPL